LHLPAQNNTMLNVIIKTFVIYFFLMLVMRLMGKRQSGQLQPFDFVIAVMIAEVAATPMAGAGIPITYGIVPIITLLVLHNAIAFASLKSDKLRTLLSGKPSIVIHKGVIQRNELKKMGYNLNDLMEQLRAKDVMNISDVHYAVMETDGKLSVMLKPEKRPLQPEDIKLKPENPGFCYDLIMDGKLKPENLQKLGYSESELERVLKATGVRQIKSVFLAISDETGSVFIQDYQGRQLKGRMKNG